MKEPTHATPTPDAALRGYLASHNALCPNCRYNLRGLATNVCPECSRVLHLQVAERGPPPYLRTLCGTALATLFTTSLVLLLLWAFLFSNLYGGGGESLWVLYHGITVLFLIVWAIIAFLRRNSSPHSAFTDPIVMTAIGLMTLTVFNLLISLLRGSIY